MIKKRNHGPYVTIDLVQRQCHVFVYMHSDARKNYGQHHGRAEHKSYKYLFKCKTVIRTRVSHKIPVWLVKGMKWYYTESRPHLKRVNMNYVFQRAFRDIENLKTSQLFFVISFGNEVLRIAPLVDQFKRQVDR